MPDHRKILIASCSLDQICWQPVAQILSDRSYEVTVIETDKIITGQTPFAINVDDGYYRITYGDTQLHLSDFSAAWYRRPTLFTYLEPNAVRQHTLLREVNALLHPLWNSVPERAWLNAPDCISKAELKVTQLKAAQTLGFKIPKTVVTNNWSTITAAMPDEMIVKSSVGVLDAGTDTKFIYTERFQKHALPTQHNPFPGIWQEFLGEKKREWRITVVGNKVFSAAIYTDDDAKDDWRRHQNTSKVVFKHEEFPLALQKQCHRYMKHFGLRFGAFDFVEDNQGNITFLECNTNGQYGWLEDALSLPISEAIADELEAIAQAATGTEQGKTHLV